MCGIIGGLLPVAPDRSAIERSLNLLAHRGPDDAGTHFDQGLFLGMRRLAVIDIAGGHQPVFNEDKSIAIVFNGEIYNYLEQIPRLQALGHQFRTRSDTEVLVHLYEEKGTDMLAELRGMFAFAIWDSTRRQLFITRDRFGKKPLYYAQTPDGGLVFASELKALAPLLLAAGGRLVLREQGIYDYLSLAVVPQPQTIYENVFALPEASWMLVSDGQIKTKRYWNLDYTHKTTLSYDQVLEETRRIVSEATRLRLRSDVPVGIFLSGGIDSSIITWEASQSARSLQTFTVAVADADYDESTVAQRTAAAMGVKNTLLPLEVSPLQSLEKLIRHFDQPFADPSAIPSFEISKLARQHVTVVLNGDGGDELFGGYRRHLAVHWSHRAKWLPAGGVEALGKLAHMFSRKRRSWLGFYARFARGLSKRGGERYLAWSTDMLFEEDKQHFWRGGAMEPTENWIADLLPTGLSPLDTLLWSETKIHLLSMLLVKMDMATMASSLEARSPLLDHKLAEFAASLPEAFQFRGGRLKAVLRDAYRPHLPPEVMQGKKRGFEIPLKSWLRNELRPVLMDTVGQKSAHIRNYLDDSLIDGLLDRRIMLERNWAYIVYSLLVLELWLRKPVGSVMSPPLHASAFASA